MNDRITRIAPSETLVIGARAKELQAQGRKVWGFAAGEPDFDTPEPIKNAAARALAEGQTKYAPVPGLPDLRKAIAAKLKAENSLPYRAEQIVVSNGGKQALFNVFMALLNPGDEVIIPAPYWLSYPEMVGIAGGKPVFVKCGEAADFKMTPAELQAALTPRTRAIVINSPSNPVGHVYTEKELRALAEVLGNRDVFIVSDEIYEKIIYDGGVHVSFGSLSEKVFRNTITVNGFSKAYSMTGWRLGYCAGPEEVIKAVSALQSHTTSGANTFAQYGALEALNHPSDAMAKMVKAFEERRTFIYQAVNSLKGVRCVKPMGAFYLLADISSFGLGSAEFASRLLDTEGVAVIPGAPFGADTHVRFSYACGMDNIRGGTAAFARFVNRQNQPA
jgi:aspartate aminotransferase